MGLIASGSDSTDGRVSQLQKYILDSGLVLPPALSIMEGAQVQSSSEPIDLPMPSLPPAPSTGTMSTVPIMPDYTLPTPSMSNFDSFTPDTMDDPGSSFPPLKMFFNVDFDAGDDDADFLPPTSPGNESEGEDGPSPTSSAIDPHRGRKGKTKSTPGRGRKRRRDNDNDHDEDDDFFEDDDVEDEDLFLPIEDVPVPPAAQMDSAMRSLGVDNQEQLASLINQMVTAGKDGMTTEMVDKLKVLVGLVGEGSASAEQT